MNAFAQALFLFACVFVVVSWVAAVIILNKMKFDGFSVSDLWNPTGELYRRYVREAKRRNWSLLPIYVPFLLLAIIFLCFIVLIGGTLRTAFS